MALGSVVVVLVVSPVTAADLAGVAGALAHPDDGLVVPVTVLRPGAGAAERRAAEDLVATAVAAAEARGVAADGAVLTAGAVDDAVLDHMARRRATLAVMGWQGASTHQNVFGSLIDSLVGRSTIPVAIVRVGAVPFRRLVLPISEDHFLPGGARGLELASSLGDRLRPADGEPVMILRTGTGATPLPAAVTALGDRVHHDRRRVDHAVGAVAGPEHLVVAPVAPTASGLRTATTHMAWAAPDAWLVVAIDVGPPSPEGALAEAVRRAGRLPGAEAAADADGEQRIVVTARWPEPDAHDLAGLVGVLRLVGITDEPEPVTGEAAGWCVPVTVVAPSPSIAVGAVLDVLHDADALEGAEITYEVVTGP